jgi:hypothetical protein
VESFEKQVQIYRDSMKQGDVPRVYQAIIQFLSLLRKQIHDLDSNIEVGNLYQGYLDMSYFSFVYPAIKAKKMKMAVVYLHADDRFELWLCGRSKTIQRTYHHQWMGQDVHPWTLSTLDKGVDSILHYELLEQPAFNQPTKTLDELVSHIQLALSWLNDKIIKG